MRRSPVRTRGTLIQKRNHGEGGFEHGGFYAVYDLFIVSTGLGSTQHLCWLGGNSINVGDGAFDWDANHLHFYVREPFPSQRTNTSLVFGAIASGTYMTVAIRNGGTWRDLLRRHSITMSKPIASLEVRVGIRLIERTTKSVALRRQGAGLHDSIANKHHGCILAPFVTLSTSFFSARNAIPTNFAVSALYSEKTRRLAASWPVWNISSI